MCCLTTTSSSSTAGPSKSSTKITNSSQAAQFPMVDERNIPFCLNEPAKQNRAGDSEDDLYEQAKLIRAAKLAAKAVKRSRSSSVPSLPETVNGKRHITYKMEKNRGLTRARNKDTKNPRKNNRKKHEKKVKNRKGQVREIKKPIGLYGGETSGINSTITRSVRFNN